MGEGIDCLSDAVAGSPFYAAKGEGFEAELARRLERFRELRQQVAERRRDDGGDG